MKMRRNVEEINLSSLMKHMTQKYGGKAYPQGEIS
jgi:hypothetical protein